MVVSLLILLLCWAGQGCGASPLLSQNNANPAAFESVGPEKREVSRTEDSQNVAGDFDERANIIGVTAAELVNFRRYAQWAGASYCNPVANTSVYCLGDICPAGGDESAVVYDVFHGALTDILAFLAISPATSEIIVSVRGTSSLTNWLDDVLWEREATTICSGCTAHMGFLSAYNEIVGPINTSLRAAMAAYPTYKIIMTGHSLGGAIATLLAMHFRDALRGLLMSRGGVALYTYGSPRVGNLALATYVTQQQTGQPSGGNFRVTHNHDVVPRVPPAIEGFRHVSPEYWLTPGPDTRTVYAPGDVQECDGYANAGCNAGAPWYHVDVTGHLYYLVAISHCGMDPSSSSSQLSFAGAGAGAGAGPISGGQPLYGNGTGPVNGTTATNGTSGIIIDNGLTPETTNTLAMYAKLDQEFMAALKQTGGETTTAGGA